MTAVVVKYVRSVVAVKAVMGVLICCGTQDTLPTIQKDDTGEDTAAVGGVLGRW